MTIWGNTASKRCISYVKTKAAKRVPATRKPNLPKSIVSKHSNTGVLDTYFQEARLSKLYDNFNQPVPYVSPQTPITTDYKKIKGMYTQFMQTMYAQQLIKLVPCVYRCPDFSAYYYPPWHFLAMGRKSRPAVSTMFGPGAQNNAIGVSKTEEARKLAVMAKHAGRSRNPVHYAYWRGVMSKHNRKYLLRAYNALNGPDGLYVIRSDRVATDPAKSQEYFDNVIKRVRTMVNSRNGLDWVAKTNSKVDLAKLNQRLRSQGFSPVSWVSPEGWW